MLITTSHKHDRTQIDLTPAAINTFITCVFATNQRRAALVVLDADWLDALSRLAVHVLTLKGGGGGGLLVGQVVFCSHLLRTDRR